MNVDSFPTKTGAPDYDHSLDPLDAGNEPGSPNALPPGGCVDGPGPVQRWPYGGAA
jgi:hypothetical protein